jgi:hypothetical protein
MKHVIKIETEISDEGTNVSMRIKGNPTILSTVIIATMMDTDNPETEDFRSIMMSVVKWFNEKGSKKS